MRGIQPLRALTSTVSALLAVTCLLPLADAGDLLDDNGSDDLVMVSAGLRLDRPQLPTEPLTDGSPPPTLAAFAQETPRLDPGFEGGEHLVVGRFPAPKRTFVVPDLERGPPPLA
jgi:hypothetical protein